MVELRLLGAMGLTSAVLAVAGCRGVEPRAMAPVTKVVRDTPELRSALIQLGWSAAAAHGGAPLIRFADVDSARGDEIIVAWERPLDDGGPRAAISVHRLDTRTNTVIGICFDASGDGFDGGLGGAIEVRDVTGDFKDDLLVRRRVGDDLVLTIYAQGTGGFGPLGRARGHRIECRDLDGDRRAEVLVSRQIGEGLRGFPEILRMDDAGRLTPAVKRYDGVMPDATKAYVQHVREATHNPVLRELALKSAASYLRTLGHEAEAGLLEHEAGFVAPAAVPAPDAPTVAREE